MASRQVHLVRHGEVYNPDHVLYGRLPEFHLSQLGRRMAQAAADELTSRERPVAALIASPLIRAQESAAPHAALFKLDLRTDPRIIEPSNHFEGKVMAKAVKNPVNWPWLINPARPSWGEPYRSIVARVTAAMTDAFALPRLTEDEPGDVIMVSHQLPIWVTHLSLSGERLMHDPRQRRCDLSSITTFEQNAAGVIHEVGYSDPAAALLPGAIDVGAV
ncbi:histidine phosphatase family protein [Gryllotalpicola protaetiae]|uniref:Histidine phosphatase family protein n=1 Tax=Gryllotalpicola protaetiae TaxID=2419771 RepID=A0A387BN34_9MICO|nr:histidine phosphatase family protein [Gryllotalpicola protaetiae]AYG03832.1 histidine phosphatase family protein [Gryllotalpicola protaetiae]